MANVKKSGEGKKLYTKQDIQRARKAMLQELAAISGGRLLKGCCTQGCCERDAQEFTLRLPP
jgi:hypothetical protein